MSSNSKKTQLLSIETQAQEVIQTFSFLFLDYDFHLLSVQLRREHILEFSKKIRTQRKDLGRIKVSFDLYWDRVPSVHIAKPQINVRPKTERYYYSLDDIALSVGREELVMKSVKNKELSLRTFRKSLKLRKQILLECCEDFLFCKNYEIFKQVSKLVDGSTGSPPGRA